MFPDRLSLLNKVSLFLLGMACLVPIPGSADEEIFNRRAASDYAVRLVNESDLRSHMFTLASHRRWASLVSFGNYALTTKHAVLLDPKNRIRDDEPYDSTSRKHSILDEDLNCRFFISTHWNLVRAHLGIGNVKQATVHLKKLSEGFEALANAPLNGPRFTPDFELAVIAEQRCRMLLNEGHAEAYLECVIPHIPLLEKHAKLDKSGGAADSLSMIRLIEGRWDESDKLLQQSLTFQHPSRFSFLSVTPTVLDRRFILSQIARKKLKLAVSHLKELSLSICQFRISDASESENAVFEQPQWFLQYPGNPFLGSSIASFASVDPAMVVPALEGVMVRKRHQWSNIRGFANSIHRKANESGKTDAHRSLAQVAGSTLIARSHSQRIAATNDADGILNYNSNAHPYAVRSYDDADLAADRPNVAKIQATLKPGSAILECTATNVIDFENLEQGVRWKSPRYVAWLISQKGAPIFVDIGEQVEIDKLVTQCQKFAAVAPNATLHASDRENCQASIELAKRVLEPLKIDWDKIDNLVICPDGALWLIPWAALPVQNDKFLLETCEISFSDTAASRLEDRAKYETLQAQMKLAYQEGREALRKELVAQKKTAEEIASRLSEFDKIPYPSTDLEPPPPATAPVIVADADYDADHIAILKSESKHFQANANLDPLIVPTYDGKSILPKVGRLKGTANEAAVVSKAIRDRGKTDLKVLTGVGALESIVRSIKNPEILVFATHGFFLPQLPRQGSHPPKGAAGSVRPNQEASEPRSTGLLKQLPAGYAPLDLIENPYFRCGLLLAGANSNDKWGEVRSADGILTGLEVAMMDLRSTKLVVLSACETGLGDPTIGEGIASLRQAFHMAGAESVVASLWQVPDAETAELIGDFFSDLKDSTPAAALRKAQLNQIAKRRELYGTAHPYYWAAFCITGH